MSGTQKFKQRLQDSLDREQDSLESVLVEEKDELLKSIDECYFLDSELSKKNLIFAFCILFGAIILITPKIYLKNNIYYTSKEVHRLQIIYDSLIEERANLNRKLEDIKFRYLTTDINIK